MVPTYWDVRLLLRQLKAHLREDTLGMASDGIEALDDEDSPKAATLRWIDNIAYERMRSGVRVRSMSSLDSGIPKQSDELQLSTSPAAGDSRLCLSHMIRVVATSRPAQQLQHGKLSTYGLGTY